MRKCSFFVVLAACLAMPIIGAGYNPSGHKWKTRSVGYYINPANNDVGEAALITAVQNGAAAWSLQSNADFSFYYIGKTTGASFASNLKNEVFFRGSNGALVGETYRWYNALGEIIDSDIAFYDASTAFTTAGGTCTAKMVIENFATHEFGHMLGLSHSSNTAATMYPSSKACSTEWMSLATDDLNGIEALYPGGSVTTNAKPVVAISTSLAGLSVTLGSSVTLSGTATDREDGNLASSLAWSSNLDGALGTGASVTKSLSGGVHTITAKAKDSAGAIGSDSVSITVSVPLSTGISLSASGFWKYDLEKVRLTWTGAKSTKVDVYRNDKLVAVAANDGEVVDAINLTTSGTYTYRVCEKDTTKCSGNAKVVF